MGQEHVFEGRLAWTGRRSEVDGRLRLERAFRVEFDGKAPIEGSSPAVFSGDDGRHNPETLMVASLMACHHLTYVAVCERAGIALASYHDHATGILGMKDGRMRMTGVTLRPQVRVLDAAQRERAAALHAKAHEHCFMSNSVNFDVTVEPDVQLAAP
ncbi:MAG: OsmC family protein [Burkholderiales bacterium]|jgi:organic hydroperoxide reductase OsmC/OhrA|nr:OsmC family protein [Burkholderiales bacterium]MCA3229032.1 OsmC family protein [Burkholderiales bacterium]